jgi:hypothetical protein
MATSTNSHDKGGAESLLPGVVLSEVGSTSAHQAAVPDPPHAEPTWRASNRIVNTSSI